MTVDLDADDACNVIFKKTKEMQSLFLILFVSVKVPECLHGFGLFPSGLRKIVGSEEYIPDILAATESVVTITIKMWGEDGFGRLTRSMTI